MGSKKNVSVDGSQDHVKIIDEKAVEEAGETTVSDAGEPVSEKKTKKVKASGRSKRYVAARALVDRSKLYAPAEAVELVKKTAYANFKGSVRADLVLKETNNQIKVSFPHSTGRQLRVAIVDDDLIAKIQEGVLDFDVLLTTPQFMPKLARLARILGPKGLMPNPKNNTIVADPEKAKAELLSGSTIIKTARKAPLLHVTLGKVDSATADLVDNLQAVIKACEGKVLKVVISASMGPGVKVEISKE